MIVMKYIMRLFLTNAYTKRTISFVYNNNFSVGKAYAQAQPKLYYGHIMMIWWYRH